MCELFFKIDCPYKVTLFIDKIQYFTDEGGEYIIKLDPAVEHELEIIVQNNCVELRKGKEKNPLFKFKDKYSDRFDDLVYKAKFAISNHHKTSKIAFVYKKAETLNFEKKQVWIPFLKNVKKNNINIYNIQKSVFIDKKAYFSYVFRHRWFKTILYLGYISICVFLIITHYYNHINNVEFDPVRGSFASTHIGAIIEQSLVLMGVLIWGICRIIIFFRKIKQMSDKVE